MAGNAALVHGVHEAKKLLPLRPHLPHHIAAAHQERPVERATQGCVQRRPVLGVVDSLARKQRCDAFLESHFARQLGQKCDRLRHETLAREIEQQVDRLALQAREAARVAREQLANLHFTHLTAVAF